MEETKNDKPGVEPHNKIRVDGEPTLHILKSTRREGLAQGTVVVEKGTLPCVGCVDHVVAGPDRSCEGVLSSVYELTSLAVLPVHCLRSLTNQLQGWLG